MPLGKCFLIATASIMAGARFGASPLAANGVWTVAVLVGLGTGCIIGAAIVKNLGGAKDDEEAEESPRTAESTVLTLTLLRIEDDGILPADLSIWYAAWIIRQREQNAKKCKSLQGKGIRLG
jgi:hypothetical protein